MNLQNNIELDAAKNNLSNFKSVQQYLTFNLDHEEYGIDILSVVEIRGWEMPTPIPSAPVCVKGVINLRGNIVPVVDLRARFSLPEVVHGPSTVLIVVQIEMNEQKKMLGIVVDGVSDVYSVNSADIKPKPEVCDTPGQEFISSLVTIKEDNKQDKLVIILEPECLFHFHDFDKTLLS